MIPWTGSSPLRVAKRSLLVLRPRSVVDSSSLSSFFPLSWSSLSSVRASTGTVSLSLSRMDCPSDGRGLQPLARSRVRAGALQASGRRRPPPGRDLLVRSACLDASSRVLRIPIRDGAAAPPVDEQPLRACAVRPWSCPLPPESRRSDEHERTLDLFSVELELELA